MKQKCILVISTYFPPEPSIASLRAYSFAKYWARMGNEVTVLTTTKSPQPDIRWDMSVSGFDVIEVPYVNILDKIRKTIKKPARPGNSSDKYGKGLPVDAGKMIIKRPFLLDAGSRILKSLNSHGLFTTARMPDANDTWIWPAVRKGRKLIGQKSFDWVYSSYGPPASHIVAGILSKKYGLGWVADYRDLWIEGHIYPGLWPFTLLEKHLEKKYVGKNADIITTVSEPLANVLQKKFSAPVYVIENGYDEDDYSEDFLPYFYDGKKRIIYTGSIYNGRQDPSPPFSAIASIAGSDEAMRQKMSEEFEVLFFGTESNWLNNLIEKFKVQQWVKYMGNVSRANVLRIQKQADMLLFLEWGNGQVDGILTGKIFEYMAMKKPILGVGVPPDKMPRPLMEEAGLGIAVGNDVGKIASILRRLLSSGKSFDIQPREEIISRYTRRKQAEKLFDIIQRKES